jgi:hypothetical protein
MDITRTTVKTVECLGEVDDYVYDISMAYQDPFFFANDILVHNTDSVYFSAWPVFEEKVKAGEMKWDKDICVQLYDQIAEAVNESFPGFMERACHCPRDMGEIIKAGRELVASQGLFIVKKRYAVLVYDKEGKRLDTNGKHGKVKAMGLDLKRADTPKVVQNFLSKILEEVLIDEPKGKIIEEIKEFKREFQELPAWEKGTPKRVNNLTVYTAAEDREGRTNMPGHVRAAMNWNTLRRMYGDNRSMTIVDGMKVIVCKMKDNPIGFTSVAFPVDETNIPTWFKDLPFDSDKMESVIVDQKLKNLLGVLDWDIVTATDINTNFNQLFSFE